MRRQKTYHYIYKITRFDGKYYIGLHSTNNLDDGYFGSGKYLRNSINYHGLEKHTKEIIEFLPDRQSLKDRERELVNEECVSDPLCMNLKKGGEGGFDYINENMTEEIQQKRLVGNSKGGIKTGYSNIKLVNDRIKEDYDYGSIILNIRRNNLLLGCKYWKGKHHTEESKRKIGETNSIKQKGELNSQYGTCWVTNGVDNKKIKKEELDLWIEKGYHKGRKC